MGVVLLLIAKLIPHLAEGEIDAKAEIKQHHHTDEEDEKNEFQYKSHRRKVLVCLAGTTVGEE